MFSVWQLSLLVLFALLAVHCRTQMHEVGLTRVLSLILMPEFKQ